MINRVLLVAFVLVTAASLAEAAPAPLPKPARQEGAPGVLLVALRADGYDVQRIERGDQPGAYWVTFTDRYESGGGVQTRTAKVQVLTSGGKRRAEVGAHLA